MSAAVDNEFLTEQQLWTLAIAWPGLTSLVRVGNRIRFDQLAVPWPEAKPTRQVADAPELKLDVASSRPDRTAPRTFCIQPDVNTVNFEWTITGSGKNLNDVSQVKAELKACMVAAGTQLGIPAVVARWEWSWRPGRPSPKERQLVITQAVTIKG